MKKLKKQLTEVELVELDKKIQDRWININKMKQLLKLKGYNNHYDMNKLAIQFNLSRITIKNHLQQWGIFKDQRKTY
jgi:hypothetical protein